MPLRFLTALPVYNEENYVEQVLESVSRYAADILVVDDGSSDGTARRLAAFNQRVHVVTHQKNQGYGAALRTAFQFACDGDYDVLVTIDCDGQHEPQRISEFVAACRDTSDGRLVDIVSGSRYLKNFHGDGVPPEERRSINLQLTAEINHRFKLNLTDAFCGFKSYRVACLPSLRTSESGYAMPLELWVRAASAGLRIMELPVPLIYLEEKRSFGGILDDGQARLSYYHRVLERSIHTAVRNGGPDSPTLLYGEPAE
jgi:glycosyltransferase involved in cell wall biosynthesis